MANTTDKSILTAAGKALLAQLNAEEKPLIIDKMIFANVPNRPEFPQPDDVVPTDDIVHQEQVEQRGRLSADSVIYSTTLTSDVGPFEFNWTGAYCSEYGVLVTIDHHALTPKTADEPGVAGNTLVRSVVLEYKDIAEITNITVDASSWQYNATDRMKKMDSDVAQSIIDQNGKDWFIEDGFLVTPSGNAYNIKAGAGYVSGNRVSMEFDRSVQVPNKPSFIYIDAHREGTPTGEQVTLFDFVITAEEKDDYIDSSTGKDIPHYVCKIAEVLADGSVSDLRPEGESADKTWVASEMKKSSESDTDTRQLVGTLTELVGKAIADEDTLHITDINQKLVMIPKPQEGVVIQSIDLDSSRIDFKNGQSFSYLIKKAAIGAYIDAKAAGIKDGVDSSVLLEALQFASEYLRKPLDLSDVSDLQFTGKVLIDKWFHWKGKGRFKTKITPLTRTRTELGADIKGQYQWFGMKDPTKSLEFALAEDIGFDSGWSYGSDIIVEHLVNMFRFVGVGIGTNHRDITFMRCHFDNPSHEAVEVQTWDGATVDGVHMMFCSGDVDDPATSLLAANMFKCMNGTIDQPGEYGVYTIKNIVSFGNICRGYRTLNDFKRGCEEWSISACKTYEMNDCHHSTDGSRNGTFDASNTGVNTGLERKNKNFLEIQGEDIDVLGFTYDITKSDKSDTAIAGILVTDYAYPAENGDGVGNRGNQSVNVNVLGGTVKGISNHHAVRMINTKDSAVFGIKAYDCKYEALSWDVSPGKVDKSGLPIIPKNNKCDNVEAIRCRDAVGVLPGNEVSIGSNVKKDEGRFGLANVNFDSATYIPFKLTFASENLNPNPLVIDYQGGVMPLFWSSGTVVDAEYSINSTPPNGVLSAFSLEDKDITRVQYRSLQSKIFMSKGDELYVSFYTKKETSNKAAVIFFEYDENGDFLRNTYSSITLDSEWKKRLRKYVVENSDTRLVSVGFAPADFDNQPMSVGKTGFAEVKISKSPII